MGIHPLPEGVKDRMDYTRAVRPFPGSLRERIERGGKGLTILVLRMAAFGDILRTLPPVRLVRAHLPEARILWIVDDRWAPVLEGHRDLDQVIALPRSSWRKNSRSLRSLVRLGPSMARWIATLRSPRPDLVLDFHGNLRSGVLGALSGAPVRLGYSGHQQKEGNRLFTTHRVPAGSRRASRMERNLSLVRALGIRDRVLPRGELPGVAERIPLAREIAARLAGDGRPYAILAPGASRRQSYKKPPAPLLAAAARQLASRGIAALVVYGPGEEADAEEVVRQAPAESRMAPPTDLRVLAALLGGARLFVGGDSGPLHLACAVGCPVLGIYGPTDPEVNAPWGVPQEALYPPGRIYTGIKRRDRSAGGFAGLEPRMAQAAVDRVLALAGEGAEGACDGR